MLQSLNLPNWLPWWVPLALLVPALLRALSFLFMPFSVFGVKSRLEVIEARLDEIQSDIRHVALRFPPGGGPGPDYDDVYPPRMQEPRPDRVTSRPPFLPRATNCSTRASTAGRNGWEPRLEDRPPPPPTPGRRDGTNHRRDRPAPSPGWTGGGQRVSVDGQSDKTIRRILTSTPADRAVGASMKPWRASHGVMRFLLDHGFDVTPVNPDVAGQTFARPNRRRAPGGRGTVGNGGCVPQQLPRRHPRR